MTLNPLLSIRVPRCPSVVDLSWLLFPPRFLRCLLFFSATKCSASPFSLFPPVRNPCYPCNPWLISSAGVFRAASLRFLFPLRFLLFTFSAFLFPQQLHAQSGTLEDTNTFNPGTGVDLAVYSIAIQTNGQILIAGDFTSFDNTNRINVARLNANGSLDDGFDPS